MIAWDSRYLPELESEMRSVLDIDMSFFGFEVCINFVRMRSENVPHLYFGHTAIGIQNHKYRLCDFPCAENNYIVIYQSLENKCFIFYEAARLYPALKSSRKLDSVLQSRSIRVQGGHLCFQIGPTEKKNQKCVTGHLHFVVLGFFHGQRVITIVH